MNADQQPLDDTIRDAVVEHGTTIDASIPDFDAILSGRQRHTRRLLASATLAVALIGVGGVILAGNRAEAPSNAIGDSAPATGLGADPGPPAQPSIGSATTVQPLSSITVQTVPIEYACTDPIGEDQLGRQLFGSCEPAPGGASGDYACTDRVGTENGFVIFSACEPVGQLGPIPGNNDDERFDNPEDIPVRPTAYIVQPGDYGLKVAAEFCVTLDELEAANGWSDASREFPGPGNELLIPRTADQFADGCGVGLYTITQADTVRSRVADMFCVSVQALDTANVETEGYSGFYPGLVIVIPPSTGDAC